MYETILGRDGFRKGMDLYFKRHDGCAVTCDDFLDAMASANNADLSALSRWYSQAGTPQLTVMTGYDASAQTCTITTRQVTPPTKGQPDKVPVLIPICIGLLGPDGAELPFTVQEGKFARHGDDKSAVLLADEETNTFVLSGVSAQPVPSLLRNFSAPVTMTVEGQTDKDLTFLMAHDTDAFNKCEPQTVHPCITTFASCRVVRIGMVLHLQRCSPVGTRAPRCVIRSERLLPPPGYACYYSMSADVQVGCRTATCAGPAAFTLRRCDDSGCIQWRPRWHPCCSWWGVTAPG